MKTILFLMGLIISISMLRAAENALPYYPKDPKITWASTGERFVVQTTQNRCDLFSENGTAIGFFEGPHIQHVNFSPNGEKVAYVLPNKGLFVYVVNTAKSRKLTEFDNEVSRIGELHWSPKGDKIAYWMTKPGKNNTIISRLEIFNLNKSEKAIVLKRKDKEGRIRKIVRIEDRNPEEKKNRFNVISNVNKNRGEK